MDNTAAQKLIPIKSIIPPGLTASDPPKNTPSPNDQNGTINQAHCYTAVNNKARTDSKAANPLIRIAKRALTSAADLLLVSLSISVIFFHINSFTNSFPYTFQDIANGVLFSSIAYNSPVQPTSDHFPSGNYYDSGEALKLFEFSNSTNKLYTEKDLLMLYNFTTPLKEEDQYPIKAVDLSVNEKFGLSMSNRTSYDPDLLSLSFQPLDIPDIEELKAKYGDSAPIVLILHTHGTESYSSDTFYHNINDNCRTTDVTKNVVSVGKVMADYLNKNGIKTIHCTEMFDAESYNNAYYYAEQAIREYLAIYPSIQYVFDIHRDSLVKSDKTKLRPVTLVDGSLTAQFMSVIGTDENAGKHTYWEDNLAFACHLQKALNQRSPSLTRRMSLRSASYNQRYAKGSLLLEIGSCGNTLDEAKNCGLIVAEEICRIIKDQ